MQLAYRQVLGLKVNGDFGPSAVLHTALTELSGTENPLCVFISQVN